ncbi:hypothetical protein Tco_0846920 [Tanacetum coccineum]
MSFLYPITILYDFDVKDTFSSTHSLDYIAASLHYFPASPKNISSNFLDDLTKDLLASQALSPFNDNPYMKVVQAYDVTDNELPILPQALIAPPTILPPSPVLSLSPMFDFPRRFHHLKTLRLLLNHPFQYLHRSIGSSSPVRSTTPPPDYPFDESIFTEMPPKRTSTSEAPAMTQAAIKKLVADSVSAALEAQAATMAGTSNPNRNTGPTRTPVAKNGKLQRVHKLSTFLLQWYKRSSWPHSLV